MMQRLKSVSRHGQNELVAYNNSRAYNFAAITLVAAYMTYFVGEFYLRKKELNC